MELYYKILILCICVVSCFDIEAQNNALPQPYHNQLKVEKDALGALNYFIDHNALDLDIIDYSGVYETYLTPIDGQLYEDCTQQLIDGQLQLDSTFLIHIVTGVLRNLQLRQTVYWVMISNGLKYFFIRVHQRLIHYHMKYQGEQK